MDIIDINALVVIIWMFVLITPLVFPIKRFLQGLAYEARMTDLIGDFGKCVVCGKEYQIYGSDGFCDDCMSDITDIELGEAR